jgi:hypothetical protein
MSVVIYYKNKHVSVEDEKGRFYEKFLCIFNQFHTYHKETFQENKLLALDKRIF